MSVFKMWFLVFVLAAAATPSLAKAQESDSADANTEATTQLVPSEQWTATTRHALAQCLVGEADWGRVTEYSAISHLLLRRWERRIQASPTLTFERFIRQYCAVHRVSRPSARQQWVRALPWGDLDRNPGFPATVTWTNFVVPWRNVREFVEKFQTGIYADPTPTADHWGGAMDGVPLGGCILNQRVPSTDPETRGRVVQLVNRYYAVNMAERRRVQESHRQYLRDVAAGRSTISARLARGNITKP